MLRLSLVVFFLTYFLPPQYFKPFFAQNTHLITNNFSHFKNLTIIMKQLSYVFILFTSLLCLQSCASAKQNAWLKVHRTELNRLANGNMKAEEKVDALLTDYTVLMNEGLQFANPVKGVKYIKKYYTQNEAAMNKVIGESNNWITSLDNMQAVNLGLRVVKKPYIRNFVELAPKFKKKYETYRFILDMTGKVAGGFGKIGSKVIGL